MEKAKRNGIDAYKTELNLKIEILEVLLNNYDDGRRKSFYCLAVNLLDLGDISSVMEQLQSEVKPQDSIKQKSITATGLLNTMAEEKGISLKMRY